MNPQLSSIKLPKLQTCLSPYVHKLIVVNTFSRQRDPQVLDESGLLDFEYICTKLPRSEDASYFTTSVKTLSPVLHCVEDFLSSKEIDLKGRYSQYLHWTGQTDHLLELWKMMKTQDDVDDLTVLLVTTAVLERSLGNVYLVEGPEPCPSMLKDLLVSPYLRNILGNHVMELLRIIIGPPTSLNIRNVVWHGFPFLGEIPRRCIWFIILLVPSIGKVLQNKCISEIDCREPVCLPEVKLISDCKYLLKNEWLEAVTRTEFVSWDTEPFWKKLQQLYVDQRYSYCAALLLFFLEHGLRRVFATVNCCEDRILTAEATTLYTTFDEILACRLPDNSENKLCQCISAELTEILMDHLQYQHGPRVRDRLSHGETCWKMFPCHLTDNLATVAIALSAVFNPDGNAKNGVIAKIFRDISEYEVQFHKIAVLKKSIVDCCVRAGQIDTSVSLNPDLSERLQSTEYPVSELHVQLTEVMQKSCMTLHVNWSDHLVQPSLSASLKYSACSNFSSCVQELLKVKINTLYRESQFQVTDTQCTDRESEVLTILDHIIAECLTVLSNIQDFVTLRQKQLVEKQLRSRQRENFKKFLSCFPGYVTVTNMCSYICCWQLYHLSNLALKKHPDCYISKLRFWKRSLQFCENLRTCSQPDKNKWTEGLDLITQYTHTIQANILSQLLCSHDEDKT